MKAFKTLTLLLCFSLAACTVSWASPVTDESPPGTKIEKITDMDAGNLEAVQLQTVQLTDHFSAPAPITVNDQPANSSPAKTAAVTLYRDPPRLWQPGKDYDLIQRSAAAYPLYSRRE